MKLKMVDQNYNEDYFALYFSWCDVLYFQILNILLLGIDVSPSNNFDF